MNTKNDAFTHVLLPGYYKRMIALNADIPKKYAFVNIEAIHNMETRRKHWNGTTKQVISYANINAEDYANPETSARLCREANEELIECINENNDMFSYGAGILPMNNIDASLEMLDFIADTKELVGVQLFTRHLGKSIADPEFLPVLQRCAENQLIIFLHPVFDERKPDNNIVFSWEYELSQAMLELVQADIFEAYPGIKIVVHHAGAMVPFFAGRIEHIMPDKKDEFKKFYVDTALLGNSKALELAIHYFGIDHVLYGTDAPFGQMPSGATEEIEKAIEALPISEEEKDAIYHVNFMKLL